MRVKMTGEGIKCVVEARDDDTISCELRKNGDIVILELTIKQWFMFLGNVAEQIPTKTV